MFHCDAEEKAALFNVPLNVWMLNQLSRVDVGWRVSSLHQCNIIFKLVTVKLVPQGSDVLQLFHVELPALGEQKSLVQYKTPTPSSGSYCALDKR